MQEASLLTLYMALYAATLSTVTALTLFFRSWQRTCLKRGHIQMRCSINHIVPDPDGNNKLYFNIFFTNTGKKPVTIQTLWGMCFLHNHQKQNFLFAFPQLPKTIAPGETVNCHSADLTFLKSDVKKLYALDTQNKKWELPYKDLVLLKRQVKKLKVN